MQIIKIPGVNSKRTTSGCERAGNAILEALKDISLNEVGKVIEFEKLDLEEIHLDNSNLDLTNKLIYENSFEAFEIKSRVIFLGGDHSISFSITNAFLVYCKQEGKEPSLIVFDSSPNCFSMEEGKKFPTNKGWLRG